MTTRAFSTTIATAISLGLLLLGATASANRPAMDSRPAADNSTRSHAEENNAEPPSAPSSVELMMQQESGTVLQQLPPKEIQPGETIIIQPLDMPRRGASMDKVRNEFGEPLSTTPAVGNPPISSWIYPDRIVYFEYATVLHVVAR
ncbi:MAG TPA: hypothetical protein ENJ64_05105 [Thiotrichales bacterium]|nr:hypothetical protein [Thiotrichales bacterium]